MKFNLSKLRRDSERYHRSNNYREKFTTRHKGLGGMTCCSYCGKIIRIKEAEVDHITPVNKVESSLEGKLFIDFFSFFSSDKTSGVNSDWNLTYACHDCNSLKRAKSGEWSRRGYFGKFLYPLVYLAMLVFLVISSVVYCVDYQNNQWAVYCAVLFCIGVKVAMTFSANQFKNRFRN